MLSATARVMIMVIEAVDGGVKESPTQPASPSAATTDIATTVSVESIPEKDRSSKTSVSVITPYTVSYTHLTLPPTPYV